MNKLITLDNLQVYNEEVKKEIPMSGDGIDIVYTEAEIDVTENETLVYTADTLEAETGTEVSQSTLDGKGIYYMSYGGGVTYYTFVMPGSIDSYSEIKLSGISFGAKGPVWSSEITLVSLSEGSKVGSYVTYRGTSGNKIRFSVDAGCPAAGISVIAASKTVEIKSNVANIKVDDDTIVLEDNKLRLSEDYIDEFDSTYFTGEGSVEDPISLKPNKIVDVDYLSKYYQTDYTTENVNHPTYIKHKPTFEKGVTLVNNETTASQYTFNTQTVNQALLTAYTEDNYEEGKCSVNFPFTSNKKDTSTGIIYVVYQLPDTIRSYSEITLNITNSSGVTISKDLLSLLMTDSVYILGGGSSYGSFGLDYRIESFNHTNNTIRLQFTNSVSGSIPITDYTLTFEPLVLKKKDQSVKLSIDSTEDKTFGYNPSSDEWKEISVDTTAIEEAIGKDDDGNLIKVADNIKDNAVNADYTKASEEVITRDDTIKVNDAAHYDADTILLKITRGDVNYDITFDESGIPVCKGQEFVFDEDLGEYNCSNLNISINIDDRDLYNLSSTETLPFKAYSSIAVEGQTIKEKIEEIEGKTNPSAESVTYSNDTKVDWDNVKKALDGLISKVYYVEPKINTFTMDPATTDYEVGQSVASLKFDWIYNKDITTQSLTDATLELTDRTATITGPFTTNKTFTLTCGDGENTATASKSIAFKNKIYYGSAAIPGTFDSAFILGLSDKKFATTYKGKYSVTVATGEYAFVCCPSSWNMPNSAKIGGFGTDLVDCGTISFTNASGGVTTYKIVRTSQASLGSIEILFE